jgi:hypothetical protein
MSSYLTIVKYKASIAGIRYKQLNDDRAIETQSREDAQLTTNDEELIESVAAQKEFTHSGVVQINVRRGDIILLAFSFVFIIYVAQLQSKTTSSDIRSSVSRRHMINTVRTPERNYTVPISASYVVHGYGYYPTTHHHPSDNSHQDSSETLPFTPSCNYEVRDFMNGQGADHIDTITSGGELKTFLNKIAHFFINAPKLLLTTIFTTVKFWLKL